jgi:hypothetical protein
MPIINDIVALTQAELHLLKYVVAFKRNGVNVYTVYQEMLPDYGYTYAQLKTMLDSLVTKGWLTLPVPYGTAGGPTDVYLAVYRPVAKAMIVGQNYVLAEQIRFED